MLYWPPIKALYYLDFLLVFLMSGPLFSLLVCLASANILTADFYYECLPMLSESYLVEEVYALAKPALMEEKLGFFPLKVVDMG